MLPSSLSRTAPYHMLPDCRSSSPKSLWAWRAACRRAWAWSSVPSRPITTNCITAIISPYNSSKNKILRYYVWMQYKGLIFDIDGTVGPLGVQEASPRLKAAFEVVNEEVILSS